MRDDYDVVVIGGGVLGSVHHALLWRQWSADLKLFAHTAPAPTPQERERLAARGIEVVAGEVAALEDGGVRMRSGELVPRAALVVATRVAVRADMLAPLGLEPVEQWRGEVLVGTAIEADPLGATAVPGVYVAGTANDPFAQVIAAAAVGHRTGAAINMDLVEEDTRAAVERARR